MELSFVIPLGLLLSAGLIYGSRRLYVALGRPGVPLGWLGSIKIWSALTVAALVWLLLLTPFGSGLWVAGNKVATVAGCGLGSTSAKCTAAKVADKQAEIDQAKHSAEVAAATDIATAAAEEEAEANRVQNNGQPCAGRWADERNCKSIGFGANEKHDRTTPVGYHLVADDPSKITVLPLGGNDYRIIPIRPKVRVRIWEQKS